MNIWAAMLADLPATAQRTIARFQRVSLPRNCPPDERMRRLRTALCRAKTVRAVYFSLDEPTRAAIQDLRQRPRGLRPEDVTARYGSLRSWTELAADPRPHSITERLVLLGWLILRPAAPRNPPRLIVPPEVRRSLPRPPVWTPSGPVPARPFIPPAVITAETLLLACIADPPALRDDGTLRTPSLRNFLPHLTRLAPEAPADLVRFTWQLLLTSGMVHCVHGRARISPAGSLWFAATPDERQERLRSAWEALPGPDLILAREMITTQGLDWPLLCRRLQYWAAALPTDHAVDPAQTYPTLSAAFGPLADSATHGFRRVTRAPWQPRRAEAIWLAALHGPLCWLGMVGGATDDGQRTADDGQRTADGGRSSAVSGQWSVVRAEHPGEFCVPHGAGGADLAQVCVALVHVSSDAAGHTYRVNRRSLAHGVRAGVAVAVVVAVLERRLGALPEGWWPVDLGSVTRADLQSTLVITAAPGVLEQAARARSVRRYLADRLAPGIALVTPEDAPALRTALERQGVALCGQQPERADDRAGSPLSAGERAALALAGRYLHVHAPQAGLALTPELIQRLEADLAPALRAGLAQAAADLGLPNNADAPTPWEPPAYNDPAAPAEQAAEPNIVRRIADHIASCTAVELEYCDAEGIASRRTVRPLELRRRGDIWYLQARCALVDAERTFRVDRIRVLRAVA
jgi:hypothetical protein